MGRITVDQSHQVMATLAINTNWDEIDFEQARLQEFVIRNPKGAGEQFGAFLKNGGRVVLDVRAFQVWKTIKLGTHKDAAALIQAIVENGLQVSEWALDIMGKPAFTLAAEETTLDLANISVADLGFAKATPLKEIYAKAIELGLSLCPADVGPQLSLIRRATGASSRSGTMMLGVTSTRIWATRTTCGTTTTALSSFFASSFVRAARGQSRFPLPRRPYHSSC